MLDDAIGREFCRPPDQTFSRSLMMSGSVSRWSPTRGDPTSASCDLHGAIGDRLETNLVEITARTVGSHLYRILEHPSMIRWLSSLDNVHVLDAVGQREPAATVQACDIGVIHRDQDCIGAMPPLKLYEYLAAGLPVVSVDLPPIRGSMTSDCGSADARSGPRGLSAAPCGRTGIGAPPPSASRKSTTSPNHPNLANPQ
jgi:hypothetical protein